MGPRGWSVGGREHRYQVIFLRLSDGRTIAAIVPEFCKEGDKLYLHPQFKVTEPRDMPSDSYWSTLVELAEEVGGD